MAVAGSDARARARASTVLASLASVLSLLLAPSVQADGGSPSPAPLEGRQQISLPLYATGTDPGRPGLYLSIGATVSDGSATYSSPARSLIVDTGSSGLNIPYTFFNFPDHKLPNGFGPEESIVSYSNTSLWGVRVSAATLQLGGSGDAGLTIENAPMSIITKKCSTDLQPVCDPDDVGFGIIGVDYWDSPYATNVFRWAPAPFNTGFMITTSVSDLSQASQRDDAATRPIGQLVLGSLDPTGFISIALTQLGQLTGAVAEALLASGSSINVWDHSLPGACLSLNRETFGFATATQIPLTLSPPISPADCQGLVVPDSGGEGGFIDVPGPLPTGVDANQISAMKVEVPGVFSYDFPVDPQVALINAFSNANPSLTINTGYRFFNSFDIYLDPVAGIEAFRPKDLAAAPAPLALSGLAAGYRCNRCLRRRIIRQRKQKAACRAGG